MLIYFYLRNTAVFLENDYKKLQYVLKILVVNYKMKCK